MTTQILSKGLRLLRNRVIALSRSRYFKRPEAEPVGQVSACDTRNQNCGLKDNDSLFVVAKLNNKEINCLIDTGASVFVLHRQVFDEISEDVRPSVNRNCGKLKVADGEMITPAGATQMNFVIDGNPYSYRMLVADIEVPTVLGYDFLRDNN